MELTFWFCLVLGLIFLVVLIDDKRRNAPINERIIDGACMAIFFQLALLSFNFLEIKQDIKDLQATLATIRAEKK